MKGTGTFARVGSPGEILMRAFERKGWKQILEYEADGPDGTSGAYEKDGFRCLYAISWEGHVDGEPEEKTPQQAKTFKVELQCYLYSLRQ